MLVGTRLWRSSQQHVVLLHRGLIRRQNKYKKGFGVYYTVIIIRKPHDSIGMYWYLFIWAPMFDSSGGPLEGELPESTRLLTVLESSLALAWGEAPWV